MSRAFTVVSKSLGMYYQKNGSGPAVAPAFDDPSIDIDRETKVKYVNYVAQSTIETNRYPVSPQPPSITPQEYGTNFQNITNQDSQQYVREPNLASSVTPVDQNAAWFPSTFVTPDKIGVFESDIQKRPRAFKVSTYMEDPILANNNNSPIDAAILNATGYNETHKFIPQNKLTLNDNPDRTLKLGSTGFQGDRLGLFGTGSHVGQQGQDSPVARTQLTIQDMEKVGLNLLFDAVQGDAGLGFTLNSESDFTEAEARMAIPSLPKIGKKTSLSRFTAANTLKKINPNYNPSGVTNFYDNTNDLQTNGSFYSPYNQFDSLISLGQIALAIVMILAFVLLLDLLGIIIEAIVRSNYRTGDFQTQTANGNGGRTYSSLNNGEKARLLGLSKLGNGTGGSYPDNSISFTDIITQVLGVGGLFSATIHNPGDCLEAGVQEFFGFSFASGENEAARTSAAQQLASTSLKILLESGRMTTILREILRSGISVVEGGIADFSGGFSIAAVGNLIRKIVNLKVVKFIDVLQQIGDKVISESDLRAQGFHNQSRVSGSNASYVDSLPDKRPYLVSKSRLRDSLITGELAWSTRTAGMLSLPLFTRGNDQRKQNLEGISGLQLMSSSALPGNNWSVGPITLGNDDIRQTAERSGRISPDIVAQFENELEADYMPFYIQDLRTNEILSFHAFLEDVGEDFNVEYTTTEGYGRMDKVHIYKGTTRNVNVTFKMVATNPEDHAIMWYKINKLAMVIYPQWTQGRKVEIGNNLKFIQPFSQIPGATPVIRLRVGDLFKSNYSTMAVARLFGATTLENYNVTSNTQTPTDGAAAGTGQGAGSNPVTQTAQAQSTPTPQQSNTEASPAVTDNFQYARGESYVLRYDGGEYIEHDGDFFSTGRSSSTAQTQKVNPGQDLYFLVEIKEKERSGTNPNITFKVRKVKQITTLEDGLTNWSTVFYYKIRRENPRREDSHEIRFPLEQFRNKVDIQKTQILRERDERSRRNGQNAQARAAASPSSGATPPAPPGQASPTAAATNAGTSTPSSQTATSTSGLVEMTTENFYSPDNNPIIRAFKSSGGKGLAGVITSFKIDNKESAWGTDGSKGLRAPIMVTIQLQMAVIHDIVPGLDSNGVMNAPIWPVGHHSNLFMQKSTADTVPERQIVNPNTANQYFKLERIRRK